MVVDRVKYNLFFLFSVKDSVDYQGRSFLHAPHDVGVNLRSDSPPDRCFMPKTQVHTWEGHTKGISQIRWFPKTAHLLLSCSMDCRVKVMFIKNMCIKILFLIQDYNSLIVYIYSYGRFIRKEGV